MCILTYFWLLQQGKADWLKPAFGGEGGGSYYLRCTNGSWIDYIEGGIYDAEADWPWSNLENGVVTQFNAKCSDGEKFE